MRFKLPLLFHRSFFYSKIFDNWIDKKFWCCYDYIILDNEANIYDEKSKIDWSITESQHLLKVDILHLFKHHLWDAWLNSQ